MVYKGHIKNGAVVLDEKAPLPEGAEVEVSLVKAADEPSSLAKTLLSFAGKAEGLPADAARNLDHYLYGHPKRDE